MILPPAIFAGLAGLFFAGMMRDNAGDLPSTFIGQQAPAVPLASVDGTPQIVDDHLRGREMTVVKFWDSRCPTLRAEHTKLLELSAQGVRVAGINFNDQAIAASKYLIDDGNPFFATGFDPRGRVAIDWGVSAPPETFIVDGDGTVLFRYTGPLIGSDYEQRFLPALKSAQGGE